MIFFLELLEFDYRVNLQDLQTREVRLFEYEFLIKLDQIVQSGPKMHIRKILK